MPDSLTTLLQRVQAGEPDAVAELAGRFRDSAERLATALLNDRGDAEEVVQEALLTALARLGELRSPDAFASWFRQIVRRQAQHVLRKRRPAAVELPELAGPEAAPAENAAREELRGRIRAALEALPPAPRDSAHMFYMEERSVGEIAALLDVPAGTVRRRLFDARLRLREMLAGLADVYDVQERPR